MVDDDDDEHDEDDDNDDDDEDEEDQTGNYGRSVGTRQHMRTLSDRNGQRTKQERQLWMHHMQANKIAPNLDATNKNGSNECER